MKNKIMKNKIMKTSDNYITWTRVNNDINGNSRSVCHYLDFKPIDWDNETQGLFTYEQAIKEANKLGGRKFHTKQYGGGLVFQSYNLRSLSDKILVSTGYFVKYSRKPKSYESKHGNTNLKYVCFLRSEVTNKQGNLKKWFKSNIYHSENTIYSLFKVV
tara:strand:- start:527 stop:1003 length:477 start_codon:yes stop_codon:yes gene_type:complete